MNDFDFLRTLAHGDYGPVFAVGIRDKPDIRMAVKVERFS